MSIQKLLNRQCYLVGVHCCHSDIFLQLLWQAVLQLLLSLAAAFPLTWQHAANQGHLRMKISSELQAWPSCWQLLREATAHACSPLADPSRSLWI